MNRITRITRRDIINVSIHGFDEMTGADMKEQYPQLASFEVRTINLGDAPRDIVIGFTRVLIQALMA